MVTQKITRVHHHSKESLDAVQNKLPSATQAITTQSDDDNKNKENGKS